MCVRLIPVDDSASWLALESCKTSPKAVIVTGPFIPLVLTAAVIVCAILKTLTPAGKLQFSKSHHTETLTFRDSSSWRLAEKLEWDEYCDDEDWEVEKWEIFTSSGEELEEVKSKRVFGESNGGLMMVEWER